MHEFIERTAALFTHHYGWVIFGVLLVALIIFSVWLGRMERTWRGRLFAPLNWYSRNRAARRLTVDVLGAVLLLWVVQVFMLWVTPALRPSQLFTSPLVGPQPVRVAQAREGALDEIATYTGTVRPWEDAVIYARVAGWVKTLTVYPGDVVHRGEILVTLDLSALLPGLEKAKAQVMYWQAEFQRDAKLFKVGAISASHFDAAGMHYRAAQAALKQIRTEIGYATLRSPLDGVVAKRHVYPGVYVHKGGMIVKIDDLHRVRIQFDVGESDRQWVHPGTVVYLRFPQLSEGLLRRLFPHRLMSEPDGGRDALRARVAAVFPRENPATRTGVVEVRIDNPDLLLQSNSYVVGDLVRRHVNQGVLIPISALTTEPGGKLVVFVAPRFSKQGPVRERRVTIGVRGPDQVQIVKGVSPGEFVVTLGNRMLTDGQTVAEINRGGGE